MAVKTAESISEVTVVERSLLGAVRLALSKAAFISVEPASRPKSDAIYIHMLQANSDTPHPEKARSDLLRAAAGYFVREEPTLKHLFAVHATPELARTVIDVVGEDNVRLKISAREEYGSRDDMPLEAAFERVTGKSTDGVFWELWATLPPEAADWQPTNPASS